MSKTPTKKLGAECDYEGFHLICKETGKEFKGVMGLGWFHENGEQAFRSINGEISFLKPSKEYSEGDVLSSKEKEKLMICAAKALAMRNFLAPYIAELDPQLGKNPAGVGQIINFAIAEYNSKQ